MNIPEPALRVFITGAEGQLGRCLADCVPAGVEFIPLSRSALDITDAGAVERWFTEQNLNAQNLNTQTLNEQNPDGQKLSRQPVQILINCAAFNAVDAAEDNPEHALRINRDGAAILAAACARYQTAMVHISSDYVFGAQTCKQAFPLTEADAPAPLNNYGASKLAGEQDVLRHLPQQSLVLRTSWLFSPYGRNFLRTMLEKIQRGDDIRVVRDQVGTPTFAPELARWIWLSLPRLLSGELQGIYHASGGQVMSWYDFSCLILDACKSRGIARTQIIHAVNSAQFIARAKRPTFSALDNRRWLSALQIQATTLEQNINDCLGVLVP